MQLTFNQAVENWLPFARAQRFSEHTIAGYLNAYRHLAGFLGNDPPVAEIDKQTLTRFFASLPDKGLSRKSVLNVHAALSSLWRWMVDEGIVGDNFIPAIRVPRARQTPIVPLTADELAAVLRAAERVEYQRDGQRPTIAGGRMRERNRAIILTLLDACLRASELCALRIQDCDLRARRLFVERGKGDKARFAPFSPATGQAIQDYLASRGEARKDDPLFANEKGNALDRHNLGRTLALIGRRAGVTGCRPHRFRHTGATLHVRGGLHPFALQMLLGHSDLTMTLRYTHLANADLLEAASHSSPVSRLGL